jgi:hypothetical protein
VGDSGGTSGEKNASTTVDSKDCVHGDCTQIEMRISLATSHVCIILSKNLSMFLFIP